jgi:hypothetical protein
MVAAGAVPLVFGNLLSFLVFLLPAGIFALVLPWRFAVTDQGIALWFGFGRRRFLAREDVTVRADLGGTVVMRRGAGRVGYPLTDHFIERRRGALRAVLLAHGFDVVP